MRSLLLAVLVGCTRAPGDSAVPDSGDSDLTDTIDTVDTEPDCEPVGTWDCPIAVDELPYSDSRTTDGAPASEADSYSCAPSTDESGAEVVYRVRIEEPGALVVSVTDGEGVDVDVHLLDAADPDSCRTRNDRALSWIVQPGDYWVVADSYQGQVGDYELSIDFAPAPSGRCAFEPTDLRMFWEDCAPGIDCDAGSDVVLHTPSAGPVVKEAHLVTVDDDFDGGWPGSFTDGIAAHYALSQDASGYRMDRDEPWAPAGEGGSEYGQGSTGNYLPVLDEAWYVNMYWRDRPARGTRMLVWNPENGKVVVASGGYETGPGENTAIGGATEEIHDVTGTGHRDVLVMGFAADQTLELGPIECE